MEHVHINSTEINKPSSLQAGWIKTCISLLMFIIWCYKWTEIYKKNKHSCHLDSDFRCTVNPSVDYIPDVIPLQEAMSLRTLLSRQMFSGISYVSLLSLSIRHLFQDRFLTIILQSVKLILHSDREIKNFILGAIVTRWKHSKFYSLDLILVPT